MTAHHSIEFVSPDDPRPFASLFAIHRPILAYPGCCVGSDGGTWSRRKPGKTTSLYDTWHPLRQSYNPYGYLVVCFGPNQTKLVHRLILEAFVGPCPDGMECRHLNGRRDDDRLDNLSWGTTAEQAEDKRRHGTIQGHSQPGESHPQAKLTWDYVKDIRRLVAGGMTKKAAADRFGVGESQVRKIVKNKSWIMSPE